jgi:hypothetical protein
MTLTVCSPAATGPGGMIQTPCGHSPFFFLRLDLERQAFSDLWTELQVPAS